MMIAEAQATRTRSNKSAYIERQNRFTNINEGIVPFKYSKGSTNSSNLDVRDAVILCQKAYYNFAVFRNTIDLMTVINGVKTRYMNNGVFRIRI